MHNPNFAFTIGDASEEARGRFVEGRVWPSEDGWVFQADLICRYSARTFSLNRIQLGVERSFDAYEFALFHTLVSTGTFETNSRQCQLDGTNADDLPVCEAVAIRLTSLPADAPPISDELQQDISRLEKQLEHVRKSEMLQLAFASRGVHRGAVITLRG